MLLRAGCSSDQSRPTQVALTNNTSMDEDTLVGRSGALEALAHVICKGNEEGKVAAASALANLIANSEANKKMIIAMPDVIPAILNLSTMSEKGAAVSARALLNLVSNKEAVLLVCKIDGAITKLGKLVSTGRMDTKEDAARVFNTMVAQGKEACTQVAKHDQVLHALKSVARANNCTGEARLWALSALQGLSRCTRVRQTLLRQQIVEEACLPVLTASNEMLGEWAEAMQVCVFMCVCLCVCV